jgi:hypothetical protein
MHTSPLSATTPSELLLAELGRVGVTIEGVPDDLTRDQAANLALLILDAHLAATDSAV